MASQRQTRVKRTEAADLVVTVLVRRGGNRLARTVGSELADLGTGTRSSGCSRCLGGGSGGGGGLTGSRRLASGSGL